MPKVKISATRIKSWFQYRCERKIYLFGNHTSGHRRFQTEGTTYYSFIEKKPEDQDRSWADAGNVFEDNLIVKQLNPTLRTHALNKIPTQKKKVYLRRFLSNEQKLFLPTRVNHPSSISFRVL